MTQHYSWTVTPAEDLTRLDTFVATRLPALSRRALRELIAADLIHINQQPSKKGSPVRSGDTVQAYISCQLRPNPSLAIPIVYERTDVLVLEKPAGLPSVAQRLTETQTVANFLLARYPHTAQASHSPLEAGLVHRLDTATSGLLVAAQTRPAYIALRRQFSSRQVEKHYLARVVGHLSLNGQVRFFLAPVGKRGRHMQVLDALQDSHKQGQEAVSTYTPLARSADSTLVRVQIHTGVRHQIRAHLAALGHPVVGDTHYGAPAGAERLSLHAETIRFVRPQTGEDVQLTRPAPDDFYA